MWDPNAGRCVALDNANRTLADNASMVRYLSMTQMDNYIGVALPVIGNRGRSSSQRL